MKYDMKYFASESSQTANGQIYMSNCKWTNLHVNVNFNDHIQFLPYEKMKSTKFKEEFVFFLDNSRRKGQKILPL